MKTPRPTLLALVPLLALTACGPGAVPLDPAADAANPLCAYAMVALPSSLAGLTQRETTAQASSAWGEPAAVVLKCGVELDSAPVSDPCTSVNGVDWILKPADPQEAEAREQSAQGTWVAQTFGRTPAVEVTFDAQQVPSSTLLAELSSAVAQIPQQQQCTNLADSLQDLPSSS